MMLTDRFLFVPPALLRGPLRFVFAAVLMCSLSACVSVQAVRDPARVEAKAGDGTVVVSTTLNTGEVTQFDSILLVRVDREGTKGKPEQQFVLGNTLAGLSRDTSVFTGYLPAGEYRFLSMHDAQTLKYLPLGAEASALLGAFRVAAGGTTDLGRLVLTSMNTRVLIGRSATITDNRELLTRYAPQYAKMYDAPVSSGWVSERNHDDIAEEYARTRPQGAGGFSELPGGEILGGTRMGTIIRRGIDGRWRIAGRTGQLDAILWTVPYADGDTIAVAAGEMNTLVRVKRDGEVEAVDGGDLPQGNLFFVDYASDGTEWVVGLQTLTEAALYRSDRLDGGRWTRMRGDTIQFSFWNGARFVWTWRREGGIGYASTESRKLACYDYATRQWVEHDAPEKRRVTGMSIAPHGPVGVITSPGGGFGGVFAKTHYSMDCGANWIQTVSPYKVKVTPPLVLSSGTILESGGVFKDAGLYASRLDSPAWTKISDKVDFNEVIWAMPGGVLIAVSRGTYGIEVVSSSRDEGRTWTRELSSFDLDLYEATRKAEGK